MKDPRDVASALARSKFRSRFKLNAEDETYLSQRSPLIIGQHATRIVEQRLAAARPANDGKQTPMRGHPVFVAQHATATCCRTCLRKWHGISEGRPLSRKEIAAVVEILTVWLEARRVPPLQLNFSF